MNEISLISPVADAGLLQKATTKSVSGGFADTLSSAIAQVNKAQVDADRAVEQLQTGEAKNLHEVMITMEKADISLRLMVQMRNKAVDAYQEIMRMQV